jgi:hypothetical protein
MPTTIVLRQQIWTVPRSSRVRGERSRGAPGSHGASFFFFFFELGASFFSGNKRHLRGPTWLQGTGIAAGGERRARARGGVADTLNHHRWICLSKGRENA